MRKKRCKSSKSKQAHLSGRGQIAPRPFSVSFVRKGGGRMIYIENIFLRIAYALPVLLVAAGRLSTFRLSRRE